METVIDCGQDRDSLEGDTALYKDSIFSFRLETSAQTTTEYESVTSFAAYQLCHTKSTPVSSAREADRELLILGYAVDLRNGESHNLAEMLLKNTRTIDELIAQEANLGGKYILFYKDVTGAYALPDATASIPFCYTTGDCPLACATDSEMIAQRFALQPDAELLKIRRSGHISQAMPYHLTVYKEIFHLLPNHYFSFEERKSVRFVNFNAVRKPLSAKEAALETAPLMTNLLQFYNQNFKLYCPITSGWDSRVVLSVMLSLGYDVETYTIRHSHFSDHEPDIVAPKLISDKFSIVHNQLSDLKPNAAMYEQFDAAFGASGYCKRTLMIANTIKSSYGDGAVINGDIIGQVGKCSLHRDIPAAWATPKYFRCKLHNYSKAAVAYIDQWIANIKASGEQVNLFDLFSIESRMGRWAAQENLIYGMIGQKYINIFNSRSIIYPWTLVPRKDRKFSKIHQELINMTYPQLMEIPVGGVMPVAEKLAKKNGLTYYLASFVKYYYEKFCFPYKQKKGG